MAATNPLGSATTAADIADAALYLASDDARSVTGHVLVVDSGVTNSGTAVNRSTRAQPSSTVTAASATRSSGSSEVSVLVAVRG